MDIESSTELVQEETEIGHEVDVELLLHDPDVVVDVVEEENPEPVPDEPQHQDYHEPEPEPQPIDEDPGPDCTGIGAEADTDTTGEITESQQQHQHLIITKVESVGTGVGLVPIEPLEVEAEPDPADLQFNTETEMRKRLIAEVEKYPNIWKYSHINYRHWGLAQESWEKIAAALAMPLEECRQTWNGIRSRYAANRNLNERAKNKLRYFNALAFLEENFDNSNAEAKGDRNKNRNTDFLNYTSLLETQLIEPSSFVSETGPSDNFSYYWDDQTTNNSKLKEYVEIHKILLDQLRKYDTSHKRCLLCNRKSASKYESQLFPYTGKDRKNKIVIQDWKRSTAASLLQTIGLDLNESLDYFMDTTYCKACYQLVLDVDYWSKSIKAFQVKLDGAKKQIEDILLSNFKLQNENEHGIEEVDIEMNQQNDGEEMQTSIPTGAEVKTEVIEPDEKESEDIDLDANEPEAAAAADDSDSKETFQLNCKLKKWKRERKTRKIIPKNKKPKSKPTSEIRTRSGRLVIKREIFSEADDSDPEPEPEPEIENDENMMVTPSLDSFDNFIIHDDEFDDDFNCGTGYYGPPKSKRRRLNGGSGPGRPRGRRRKRPIAQRQPKKSQVPSTRLYCQETGCTFSSKTEFLLSVHVHKDHCGDPEPFYCNFNGTTDADANVCSAKFPNLELLNEHKFKEHGGTVPESKCKICSYCGKIFNTGAGLSQHLKVNHSAYQLKPKCGFCSKSFDTPDQVSEHEELHNLQIINRFTCILCENAVFQSQLDLQRHIQTEHETDLFKCSPCNLVFLTAMRLRSHNYIHHSLKPKDQLKCKICGFQAKTPSSLKDHSQKHGENKHRCNLPGCNAAYKWKSALKRHLQSAHTKLKPWECPLCGKSFYTASDLRRHEVYHLDLRPFMCESCPSQFKQFKHLQRHMKLHEKYANRDNIKAQTPRRGRLKTYLAQAQTAELSTELPIEVEVPIIMHNNPDELIEDGTEVIIPITMDENDEGTFTATTVDGIPVTITYAEYVNIITLQEHGEGGDGEEGGLEVEEHEQE